MKFRILFYFSIASIAASSVLITAYLRESPKPSVQVSLRQQIQLLENNATRNMLREQNLLKRNEILSEVLLDIQKKRNLSPQQVAKEEKAIHQIVQNLKALNPSTQAQYHTQYLRGK